MPDMLCIILYCKIIFGMDYGLHTRYKLALLSLSFLWVIYGSLKPASNMFCNMVEMRSTVELVFCGPTSGISNGMDRARHCSDRLPSALLFPDFNRTMTGNKAHWDKILPLHFLWCRAEIIRVAGGDRHYNISSVQIRFGGANHLRTRFVTNKTLNRQVG